jgi:hypothetical protein
MGVQNTFTAVSDGFNIGSFSDNQGASQVVNYGSNVSTLTVPISSDTGQVVLAQNVILNSGAQNATGSAFFRLPANARIHSCYIDIVGTAPLTGGTYAMYVQNGITGSPTIFTIQQPTNLPTTLARGTVNFNGAGSSQVTNIGKNVYVRFDWASVAPTTTPLGITLTYSIIPV